MDTNIKNNQSIGEQVEGVVTESLPNTMFRVDIGNSKIILTYLAGKMRINRIKILIGDKVRVQLDPYGERGRIIRRM
ncbi:MAG: translation initiation factor IF-1 [bacterium]